MPSLEDDIKQIKKAWPKLSGIARIAMAISVLISVLSVSSIANGIYEFRGFLQTGLELYRVCTAPLGALVEQLGFQRPTQVEIDVLTISLLVLIPFILAVEGWAYKLPTGVILISLLINLLKDDPRAMWELIALSIFVLGGSIHATASDYKDGDGFDLSQAHQQILYRIVVTLALFLVFAAVSEGLTRPLV